MAGEKYLEKPCVNCRNKEAFPPAAGMVFDKCLVCIAYERDRLRAELEAALPEELKELFRKLLRTEDEFFTMVILS